MGRANMCRISIIFQKTDSMRYSKYMQQCVAELDDAKEYEADALLLTYVRVQHLMERIARLNAPDETDDDAGGIPRAPALAYRSAFRAELDKIRGGLPKHLRTNSECPAPLSSPAQLRSSLLVCP